MLINAGRPSGAYYLLGYAVESALKAVIARGTRGAEFPNLKRARDSHSHDFRKLVEVAGLKRALDAELAGSPKFRANWNAVASWRSDSRYEQHTLVKARDFYKAVMARQNGVLRWIRGHW